MGKGLWAIAVLVLLLAAGVAFFLSIKGNSKPDPESVIGFVKEHKGTDI
ncbi:hypothetical protein J7I93_15910 [Bacillus sp. ISL-47]|nr:hypothetical protein [Bacillus sp. ISL-47]MBT2689674.1 hypothetical protein [Bacillus sp. ISL-47]MBT2709320.1 hypothetical protein [Pseudomonas sp. ISL-84]